MSSYPPYCCSCCGFTNADMFMDWVWHKGTFDRDREPTSKELFNFEVAKRTFWATQDVKHQLIEEKLKNRLGGRHGRKNQVFAKS